jgi:hypothetical protein
MTGGTFDGWGVVANVPSYTAHTAPAAGATSSGSVAGSLMFDPGATATSQQSNTATTATASLLVPGRLCLGRYWCQERHREPTRTVAPQLR